MSMIDETTARGARGDLRVEHRFRLRRAGILNVWQYDRQEFTAADGRILLRGANGAGKSKTLEMLLPFVLDGDKGRITASARHHTSLLWLMTDGYVGQARIGYLWVEFARTTPVGDEEFYTCGVGIRASSTAKSATAWFFTTPRRIGHDLDLEDAAGPLPRPRLAERVGEDGHVFETSRAYKEHVGRTLFGLDVEQYDDVLRLLYWLRQPQIGEDIEPARLTTQLSHALPQLDEQTLRATGETFDSLAQVGEDLARRATAAESLARLAEAYAAYARAVAVSRGRAAQVAETTEGRAVSALRRAVAEQTRLSDALREVAAEHATTTQERDTSRARREELRDSRAARDQRRLAELDQQARAAAQTARQSAETARKEADRHDVQTQRVAEDRDRVGGRVRALAARVRELDGALTEVGARHPLAVPAALDVAVPEDPDRVARMADALAAFAPDVEEARAAGRRRAAAVTLLAEALRELDQAQRDAERAAEAAALAETRWEESVGRRDEAATALEGAERDLAAAFAAWVADAASVIDEGPADLAEESVAGFLADARSAAGARLTRLREDETRHEVALREATTLMTDLQARYAAVEAERDPTPPAPALARTPRPDGGPLWRLVDFAPDLSEDDRAGLEAALQDSGLLDSWVRPDGDLLGPEHVDVVLAAGPAVAGPALSDLLRADVPDDVTAAPEVVAGLLARVGVDENNAARPFVTVDGTWALGPLRGRARKDRAQYVGATARAEERRRRLSELRAAIDDARTSRDEAASLVEAARGDIAALEAWLAAAPSDRAVAAARASLEERERNVVRDGDALTEAGREATAARSRVTGIREKVGRLATEHFLPDDPGALDALRERLRDLDRGLERCADSLSEHERDLRRLTTAQVDLAERGEAAREAAELAERHGARAGHAAARYAELKESVGADVRQLVERVRTLEDAVATAEARLTELQGRKESLLGDQARAESSVVDARRRRDEARAARVAAVREMGALAEVSGLVESAFAGDKLPPVPPTEPPSGAAFARAVDLEDEGDTPADVRDIAARLAALDPEGVEPDVNTVWRAYSDASSGPAGVHEPRVEEFGPLLSVSGRDGAGEAPVAELVTRVSAAVERDRALLTQREKAQFEQHVLGELGEAIRRRRQEADELVTAMNRLLDGVTTSQGIRVRLRWTLRADVPAEAKEAVRLLVQPLGALTPEERTTLRDSLHRLIEVSRTERPELSYGEHLGLALDYREWFSFRIQYTRPESDGSWLELHRRSPLSQGEQKVLCYLPLFAAAAAHFTSLAGAAPHAPRLVLLDDAFPKIDVRTHPLLFGLLVDLDLDFVITSERLWGDHDTVPALSIYEALRDPSERGIAQFEYRWDGRTLHSVG